MVILFIQWYFVALSNITDVIYGYAGNEKVVQLLNENDANYQTSSMTGRSTILHAAVSGDFIPINKMCAR